MIIEEMGIHKILVEMMAKIDVEEISTEAIVVIGVGQEKETNRDRIRCYKCQEYDHFVNECPNTVTSDSDDYESDNAVLQVMSTDIESCDTQDIDSYMEDTEYLNL